MPIEGRDPLNDRAVSLVVVWFDDRVSLDFCASDPAGEPVFEHINLSRTVVSRIVLSRKPTSAPCESLERVPRSVRISAASGELTIEVTAPRGLYLVGVRVPTACFRKAALRTHFEPNKEKIRARTRAAIRRGELTPLPCQVCGDLETFPHHESYDSDDAHLRIEWLCRKHHGFEHGTRPWTKQIELFPSL